MTTKLTATELKATLLAVLDDVAAGDEVEVTKRGRPVARIVPVRDPGRLRDGFAGVVMSSADDEELFRTGETWEVE